MPNQKSCSHGLFISGVVEMILALALIGVGIAMIVRSRGELYSEFLIVNAIVPLCMAALILLPMAILSFIGSRKDSKCVFITLLILGIISIPVLLGFFLPLFVGCLYFDTRAEPITVRERIRQQPDTLACPAATETALLGAVIVIFSVTICCVSRKIYKNCRRASPYRFQANANLGCTRDENTAV